MPRSFLSFRNNNTASGMAPIPSCSVAPSGMRPATFSPIRRSISPICGGLSSRTGSSFSTTWVMASSAIFEPPVRGIDRFICAMTMRALSACGLGIVRRHAVAAEPVRVGRRHLDQRHVDRQRAAPEQARHLGEEARREVRASLLDRLAGRAAEEEAVVAEALLHAGLGVFGRSHCHHVDDLDTGEFASPRHQGFDEGLRLAGRMADHDAVAGLDGPQRLGGGHKLVFISGIDVGHWVCSHPLWSRFAGGGDAVVFG